MGNEVIIYGNIEGATNTPGKDFFIFRDLNTKVIESLPEDDDWPFLTRSMFGIPKDYAIYRTPIITFGATFKDLNPEDDDWDEWVKKFENLLSKMFWWDVILHIKPEVSNGYICNWHISDKAFDLLYTKIEPVKSWGFDIKKV